MTIRDLVNQLHGITDEGQAVSIFACFILDNRYDKVAKSWEAAVTRQFGADSIQSSAAKYAVQFI